MAGEDKVTNRVSERASGFGGQLLNTGLPTKGFMKGVPAEVEAWRWNKAYFNNFLSWVDYDDIDWKARNYITQWAITGITIVANPVITAPGHDFQNGQKVFISDILGTGGSPTIQAAIDTLAAANQDGFTIGNTDTSAGTFRIDEFDSSALSGATPQSYDSGGFVYNADGQSSSFVTVVSKEPGGVDVGMGITFWGNTSAGLMTNATNVTGGGQWDFYGTPNATAISPGPVDGLGSWPVKAASRATDDIDGPAGLITGEGDISIIYEWMYYWSWANVFGTEDGASFKFHFGLTAVPTGIERPAEGVMASGSTQNFNADGEPCFRNGIWFTGTVDSFDGTSDIIGANSPASICFCSMREGVMRDVNIGWHSMQDWFRTGFRLDISDTFAGGTGGNRWAAGAGTQTILQAYDNNNKVGDAIVDHAPTTPSQWAPFFAWTSNDATKNNGGYLVNAYLWTNQNRAKITGSPE